MKRLSWRWVLTAGGFVLMATLVVAYSATVPLFEAPDEPGHYGYVERLANGQGLPVQGQNGDYDPELSQPPLYYGIEALVAKVTPADAPGVPPFSRLNDFQNRTVEGNVNLYAHAPDEGWPWRGEVLRLHLMRLLNLVFAAMTLAATYGIAREMGLSRGLAVTSAATLGLVPQFLFISGALNADNAVAASASLALWLLLRWLNHPARAGTAVWLGLASGAAMLAKLSGLGVLPFVALWMAVRAGRERNGRAVGQVVLTSALGLAVGGWWYARNLQLYRDVLGWRPMLAAIGAMRRSRPLSWWDGLKALVRANGSAIGVFGWNNLRLPQPIYFAADALVALAAIGLVLLVAQAAGQREWQLVRPTQLLVLLSWCAVFAASLVRWVAVNTDATQWRLLLPIFPVGAVLVVMGLSRLWRRGTFALPVAAGAASLGSLALVIAPAYRVPGPYAGPIAHAANTQFGDALELVGYGDPRLANGQVTLDLFWRANGPTGEDEVVNLAAMDT
ncbi:MAG: phospholipid carrier-dependent glycosyltransferase, partial [Chloroflexi bacterium]|nr:phospholipid carrier-dependent glycosyltransferase [Chloroflexota bacterium]